MADNITLPASGVPAATDDIDGVHYQRIKVGHGTDGAYSDVAAGNGLPVSGAYTELTGSASANATDLIGSTDVRAYRWLSLHLTGTFNAAVKVQACNDGTSWLDVPLYQWSGTTTATTSTSGSGNAQIYVGDISARYIRVRTTSYTSGTVTATVELFATPSPLRSVYVYGGTITPGSTSWNLLTDGVANTSFSNTTGGVPIWIFNGTTWDRVRNVTAVDGAGSTGLVAAGVIAYDSGASVNRRVRCDVNGTLQVNQVGTATATLTSVTASATSVQLLAARSSRLGVIIYNDSTAVLLLAFAATASATAFTVRVPAASTYETPSPPYTGVISGIWEAANGAARITEVG